MSAIPNPVLENFAQAFSSASSGCRRTCYCGKEFYDYAGHYDWEPEEIESLKAGNATGRDYSIETLIFEGREYCIDCDCWHERALKIIDWIDSHSHKIARFLTLEKRRKQEEADKSPVVK